MLYRWRERFGDLSITYGAHPIACLSFDHDSNEIYLFFRNDIQSLKYPEEIISANIAGSRRKNTLYVCIAMEKLFSICASPLSNIKSDAAPLLQTSNMKYSISSEESFRKGSKIRRGQNFFWLPVQNTNDRSNSYMLHFHFII